MIEELYIDGLERQVAELGAKLDALQAENAKLRKALKAARVHIGGIPLYKVDCRDHDDVIDQIATALSQESET